MMKTKICYLLGFLFLNIQAFAQQTIVPYGSSWKYLDNGTNQATAWRGAAFNDAGWASGNAKLGYGIPDATTTVSYGPDANNKYITTYFRKNISIPDISPYTSFRISVKRDDGVIIYVNGTAVVQSNLSTTNLTYTTFAPSLGDNGVAAQVFTINTSVFVNGANTIAAEVHQANATSSDIAFDMQLEGLTTPVQPALTRGPYMNLATQSGIIIRWRTDIATDSKVSYGTIAGNLSQSVTDNTPTTDHIVQLNGLATNTKYFYSVGSTSATLQGDANNYFKTAPVSGSTQKVRILAMGDMGNNSSNQVNVRNAYLTYNGTNYTDVFMLLGDNAYSNGLDNEYQTNFFNIYKDNITKNHVLWPSPGNHDYANNSSRQADHNVPYYDVFSLPANGQAGGVPSGTEAYYSYNYGNIHFVSLDSYGWEAGNTRLYDTTGPQATWLKQDLAAKTQKWTVVYFHHTPYTKGSHNSDTELELMKIRENVVRILERYKVDLVLCGHSHSYERSLLINGHYGLESSFDPALHALSTSTAKYDGSANSCPYVKNASEVRNGIVYAVVGVSGQVGGSTTGYPHNAMAYSNVTNGGSMVIEIENNRLDAKFVGSDGVIRDNFTIMKEVNKTTDTTVSSGGSVTLAASWIGNYIWSNGATTRSITVNPSSNTSYNVHDNVSCLTDIFNVTVSGGNPLVASSSAGTISCPGGTTTVTVSATGGTPPYSGTGNFTVSAGTYNYIVTDAVGTKDTTTIAVTEPANPAGTISGSSIICTGATATFTSNGSAGGNWSSDNTSVATVNTSGLVSGIAAGSANVIYTITDNCGTASASKQVTITNCAAPSITCPGSISENLVAGCTKNIAVANPATSNTTTLTWVMTGATTAASPATGINYVGTKTFNTGVTTVTYTAKNAAGTTATCQFSVTLTDNIVPTITCPTNISQAANGNTCSKTIATPNPAIADNCGVTMLTWTMSGATTGTSAGSGFNYAGTKTFNVGVTTIVYTVKDAANNSSNCSFTVTVTNKKCPGSPARREVTTENDNLNIVSIASKLRINIFPNPTPDQFTLALEAGSKESVEILITDILGRKVFQTSGRTNQTYTFGKDLRSGVYIVQVKQGKDMQTFKLMKRK